MLSQSYKRQVRLLSAPVPTAWSGNSDGFYRRAHNGLFSHFLISLHSSSLQKYQGLELALVKINSEVQNKHAKNRQWGFQDPQETATSSETPGGRSSNTSPDLAQELKGSLLDSCLLPAANRLRRNEKWKSSRLYALSASCFQWWVSGGLTDSSLPPTPTSRSL